MSADRKTLAESGALRQLKHNDGSEGFVFAYDQAVTDRYVAELRAALALKQQVVEYEQRHSAELEVALAEVHSAALAAATAPAVAPVEPERLNTDQSREYLVKFMEQHFTDKTYHRYIRGQMGGRQHLAGDFAWQMARALRMVLAPPAAQQVGAALDRQAGAGQEPVQFYRHKGRENWLETTAEHAAHLKDPKFAFGFEFRTLYAGPQPSAQSAPAAQKGGE